MWYRPFVQLYDKMPTKFSRYALVINQTLIFIELIKMHRFYENKDLIEFLFLKFWFLSFVS